MVVFYKLRDGWDVVYMEEHLEGHVTSQSRSHQDSGELVMVSSRDGSQRITPCGHNLLRTVDEIIDPAKHV